MKGLQSSRRGLLLAGGAAGAATLAAGAALWPTLAAWLPRDFTFDDVPGMDGFRRLLPEGEESLDPSAVAGGSLRGVDPERVAAARADPCRALFGAAPPARGPVAIAYFSDIRCEYCRMLSPLLDDFHASGAAMVAKRELPLLGPTSEMGARAIIAARAQRGEAAMREVLTTTRFAPTPAFLAKLAAQAGLDPERLQADMARPAVMAELASNRAVASLFGFIGVPAMVVGRTAVHGGLRRGVMSQLIRLEREQGPPAACAVS